MVSQSIVPSIALSLLLLGLGKAAHATTSPPESKPVRAELSTQSGVIAIQVGLSRNLELSLSLFERAIQVAETIPDPSARSQALAAIALKLSEAKHPQRSQQLFERAIQLAHQIPSDQVQQRQEVLRDISIQLAQAGQIPRSLQLVKIISSEFRKAQALNDIAVILVDRGNVRQAKAVLVEAAQFARGIHGDYAYESNGSCGNDKFKVLSKIAGSLSLLSQFEQALRAANSIKGCGSAIGESSQDYQAWAYLGILANVSTVNQAKQTWTSAQSIQNSWEQSIAWSEIATKLIDLGEIPFAQMIATKIAKIPSPTDFSAWSVKIFSNQQEGLRAIAIKLAQKQQFDAALQAQQLMTESPKSASDWLPRRPSTKNTTLGDIAHEAAIARRIPQALTIVNKISDVGAKALAQIAIARELQKAGQQTQAAQLLQNLTLSPTPTNSDDYQTINDVAVALVTVGQSDRAIQLAQSLQSELYKETTLTSIAAQQAALGQLDQALQLRNRLTGEGSKAIVLQNVVEKQLELGQLDQALKLTPPQDGEHLIKIADGFTRLGQQSEALQVADAIPDARLKAVAIADIAKHAADTATKPN